MTGEVVFDQAALHRLFTSPAGPAAKALKRRGLQVQAQAVRLVHQAGTGRTYTRRGVAHQASAPGQPPATDTGLLAASIREELTADALGLVEIIGSDLQYALPLELGTRNMEPRPFLRPALRSALGTADSLR